MVGVLGRIGPGLLVPWSCGSPTSSGLLFGRAVDRTGRGPRAAAREQLVPG